MTVAKLIKELQKLQARSPRARVMVDWKSFECDEHSHTVVSASDLECIVWEEDGDRYNKDGSEKHRTVVTLRGPFYDPTPANGEGE